MEEIKKYVADIHKVDEEQRVVFGWANVAADKDGNQIVDKQNDVMDAGALEKAAYEFVLNYRKSGVNHVGESVGDIVESFMVTPQKLEVLGLAKNALPTGLWIGVKIHDENVWQAVKEKKLKAFSVQGRALMQEV